MFGKGISAVGDILDLAAESGVVNKSGAWYAYEGEKLGQGRENSKMFLQQHPDMLAEIEHKVRVKYGLLKDETQEAEGGENTPDSKGKASSKS